MKFKVLLVFVALASCGPPAAYAQSIDEILEAERIEALYLGCHAEIEDKIDRSPTPPTEFVVKTESGEMVVDRPTFVYLVAYDCAIDRREGGHRYDDLGNVDIVPIAGS